MVRKSKKLPRHLIVYRTSAMGDVAMLAHALRALKRAYPDLQVTVATRPLFRAFFTDLDVGFLDVDVKGAHHSLCGIWRLAAQARRLGADAVADVHGVLRSVTFRTALRLHGIPFAAIGKGRDEKGEFIRRGGRGVKPAKHTVVRYCDVFRKLGFVFDDPKPAVRREHPSPMGEKTGTWIGFAPFSAQQGKTYPEPLARETVRLLAGRYDRVFIHSGGGAEAEFAQEMERLHPNVTALFGRVKMAGEIDLIARDSMCIVFIEVKYRANGRSGDALEAVTRAKIRQISKTALFYLNQKKISIENTPIRFDVIGINGDSITHVENAFDFVMTR